MSEGSRGESGLLVEGWAAGGTPPHASERATSEGWGIDNVVEIARIGGDVDRTNGVMDLSFRTPAALHIQSSKHSHCWCMHICCNR